MKQCKRCNAVQEDAANFCGVCGSSEFIAGAEGGAASYNGSGMPGGNGMPQQAAGNAMAGYPQGNYQQGGPMPGYPQGNYQQGGPAPGYQQINYQQGGYQPQGIPVPNYQPYPFMFQNVPPDLDRSTVSKSEFLKNYADPALKKEWRNIGIFFYIAAGLSILLAIVGVLAGWSDILDVLFCLMLLGLALGTHLGVNKVCTIILLVLSSLDTLLCLIFYGTPGGWLWILVGAMAVTKISKINTQYKQFQAGLPF